MAEASRSSQAHKLPFNFKQFAKTTFVVVPVILFLGGIHCLYDGYYTLMYKRQEIEIEKMLKQAGVLKQSMEKQLQNKIKDEVYDLLNSEKENVEEQLVKYLEKYKE